MTADLAILYEHPQWFEPLFAALERRGIAFVKVPLGDHHFDPAGSPPPAPVILSRVAMSGFLREPEHGIFYAEALLDHWRRQGATVLNGPEVLAIDSSKARQLSLITGLGLAIPGTRAVHRGRDLLAASQGMAFPLLVKANIGGAGAGIVRYSDRAELEISIGSGTLPDSIDKVLLLQDYVPPRGGTIIRIETLAGKFLYALEVESKGDAFDLCPADACLAQPGRAAIGMRAITPPAELIVAAERIATAVGMDVGGVEVVIDDRDGVARFYDINGLSNFVAKPLEVLGWDPHERLIDMLAAAIADRADKRDVA
ncbi:RimK family alpha-L-glutamate ligase [Sphingosinicella sp. BN140058]|uniref:ATP-grasp domain-containing protein n=1 Tax=Sphingosinicella sp. BN140058 TaxID=1892855 RepID=UPI001010373F|nr:alpha-L-glutamate ligase [Sphingosinicella sp. BN140058]QAY77888.1 alpha-L-glutamate ligase [Sphingosinicella sp. BN140058]